MSGLSKNSPSPFFNRMKATTMMRHHLILLTLTIVSLAVTVERPVNAAEVQRPNIIFFLTDDQRNDTLGCTGHPIVKTPTIALVSTAPI